MACVKANPQAGDKELTALVQGAARVTTSALELHSVPLSGPGGNRLKPIAASLQSASQKLANKAQKLSCVPKAGEEDGLALAAEAFRIASSMNDLRALSMAEPNNERLKIIFLRLHPISQSLTDRTKKFGGPAPPSTPSALHSPSTSISKAQKGASTSLTGVPTPLPTSFLKHGARQPAAPLVTRLGQPVWQAANPRLCHKFYFFDCFSSECHYSHHYVPSPQQLAQLRNELRLVQCARIRAGKSCNDPQCLLSHVCPRGANCDTVNCTFLQPGQHPVPGDPALMRIYEGVRSHDLGKPTGEGLHSRDEGEDNAPERGSVDVGPSSSQSQLLSSNAAATYGTIQNPPPTSEAEETPRSTWSSWLNPFLLCLGSRSKKALEPQVQRGGPFIAVIIDGDGCIFERALLSKGWLGGQKAASQLVKHLSTAISDFPQANLLIDVVANQEGLMSTLRSHGVCQPSDYLHFVRGFAEASALFSHIDAGTSKEAADTKIKARLNYYIGDPRCRAVVLAITHDRSYLSSLREIATAGFLDQIWLLDYTAKILPEFYGGSLKPLVKRTIQAQDMFMQINRHTRDGSVSKVLHVA